MNASKLHFDPCIAEIIPPGRGALTCAPHTPLHEVAERMRDAAVSSIVVTDDGCPVGIWTEHDALGIDLGSPGIHDRPVAEVMSSPVQRIVADAHLTDAAHRFRDQHIRHLLVTDPLNEAALGIISLTDVVLNQGIEHYLHFRTVGTLVGHDNVRADESEPLSRVATRMREARADAASGWRCRRRLPSHARGARGRGADRAGRRGQRHPDRARPDRPDRMPGG